MASMWGRGYPRFGLGLREDPSTFRDGNSPVTFKSKNLDYQSALSRLARIDNPEDYREER